MTVAMLFARAALASTTGLPDDVVAVVDRAAAADLPTGPLEQKAREGLAKGVAEDRVEAVLVDLVAQWSAASTVLGHRAAGPDRADLIPAAAAALHQGASSDTVIDLAATDQRVQALWTLSDVLYAGVEPAEGARLVRQALGSTHPDVALHELPEATRLLLAAEGPSGAVRILDGAMSQGNSPLAAVTSAGPGQSGDNGKPGDKGKAPTASNNGNSGNGGGKK